MARIPEKKPVEDTVAKINDELAVGSDLTFQHRWQRIERIVWIVLFSFLCLSLAGVFGRGPLANATTRAHDNSMTIKYERVQRFSTPSVLTVELAKSSIHDGIARLWASDALVKRIGTQRVIPQPAKSEIGQNGILYTFPSDLVPASIEFQSQPSFIGWTQLTFCVPGHAVVALNIFVVP